MKTRFGKESSQPKTYQRKDIFELPKGLFRFDDNLYLKVSPDGAYRNWVFVYTVNRKRIDLSLGTAKRVALQQAKMKAKALRGKLALGLDPREERRKEKEERIAEEQPKADVLTFSRFYPNALRQIESLKRWRNQKHAAQWYTTIDRYAVPVIGNMPLSEITITHILQILKPIWETKTETATRLRSRLEALFAYAIRNGVYSGMNPATWKHYLEYELPASGKVTQRKHHASIAHEELKEKLKLLHPEKGPGRALILFTILAACRIGESAPAKWDEFDFEKKIWNCPPERRKDGKPYPHRVPLTDRMIEVLSRLPRVTEYVFSYRGKHVATSTPVLIIHREWKTKATMHGMRSTFRDWCAESGVPDILAEKSLMHATGNEVVQAYQRSDLLEQRRAVMEKWSSYLLDD